ncbi:hypothetical protein ACULPM_02820 [Thermophilibacter sp. ZX-H3]|uniref:hypothetical protein n=1 Tax=unclassified Thermophilibacter TaxID=2847308 RepID=UPI0040407D2A
MPEKIKKEYGYACKISAIGATFLYALFAYCLLALIVLIVALSSFISESVRYVFPTLALISHVSTTGAVFLLAEFLRRFRKADSPFETKQSFRLSGAALFLAIRTLIDCFVPTFNPISTSSGAVIVPQSGPDLKVVVMVVFLVCLAMVVRYGDALKEDSDAFV